MALAETQNISEPATLADRLLEELQDAIVEGDLASGEKLREPELARRFGTSRGPLRDALRRLEARRLVTTTPNAGARVVALSNEQLIELFQVREALEGMTARLAATAMSDEQLEELEQLLMLHAREVGRKKGREYFQQRGDLDFHYRIADGCGNALLRHSLCVDHYQLMRMYRFKHSSRRGRPHRALHEHRRILEALQDRDGELAEILMRRHIRASHESFEAQLDGLTET